MLQFLSEVILVATVKWILLLLIKVGWRQGPKIPISKSGIFEKKKFCWSYGKQVQGEKVNVDDSIVAITLNCKFLSKPFFDSKSLSVSISLSVSLSLSLSLSTDLSLSHSLYLFLALCPFLSLSLSLSLSLARPFALSSVCWCFPLSLSISQDVCPA